MTTPVAEPRDLLAVTALPRAPAAEYLEYYGVLPLQLSAGRLMVGTWREDVDVQVIDDLRDLFDAQVELENGREQDLRAAIQRLYGGQASAEQVIAGLEAGPVPTAAEDIALDDMVSLANEAPVVKLVNFVLLEALEARASDVHLEEYADALRVRYRIDGVLQDGPVPPAHLKQAIISRTKIMADLDIAERRVPQDGRIRMRLQDRQVDVRVSSIPTLHGESVVLRLLDKDRSRVALGGLGMADDTIEAFKQAIARPHGIILVTGPTGSGKTTTLYAAVEHIRSGREKILTVEDPIEYELEGVPQVPVNEKVGVTFATALRALLRQDPDVLLVGEIRDEETAQVAIQAALTGHLVLATLHTNDAPSAITRLIDLGVAPFLVASTVELVLAQRLVRTVCRDCLERVLPQEELLTALGRAHGDLQIEHRGKGCGACRETGYRGRTGIYELLPLDDPVREEIMRRRGSAELRRLAVQTGMRTLAADGYRHVRAGATTLQEVVRVSRA